MDEQKAPAPSPRPASAGAGGETLSLSSVPHRAELLVEAWRTDHFPGSVVARYTECRNTAYGAREALTASMGKI